MDIFYFIFKLAASTFILNFLYKQSRNILLFIFQRPYSWMLFLACVGCLWFFIGSFFNFSFNLVWWAASLTIAGNLTPKFAYDESKELSKTYGAVFRTKSGLLSFTVGCALGWILFWGEACTGGGQCHKLFWS